MRPLVLFVAWAVADIPAQRFKQWVDKFASDLRFVVFAGAVRAEVIVEAFDQL